jgi:uncharacterized protein YerC
VVKGRAEGIEIGMEKGITQLLAAINMLKQKKPDAQICRESGLSADDLTKLKRQLS